MEDNVAPKLKVSDHVKGTSTFQYYRAGFSYYKTDDTNYTFFIPVEDTNDATFNRTDKSIFFMRWIRLSVGMDRGEDDTD